MDMRIAKEAWKPILTQLGVTTEAILTMDQKQFLQACNFAIESVPQISDTLIQLKLDLEKAPDMKMTERLKYATEFEQIGITKRHMLAMSQSEFNQALKLIQESGIKHECPKPHQPRTNSQTLRSDQDDEYNMAIQNAQIVQAERNAQMEALEQEKQDEEKKIRNAKEQQLATKNFILERAKLLETEPEDGLELALSLPSGKRYKRRFLPSSSGEDIYNWIAAMDEMFENDIIPIPFEVTQFSGPNLERSTSTLAQQNIHNRTVFYVQTLD